MSSLVDAALRGDDPGRLMAAAGRELRTPLGLVSRSGYALGFAPRDGDGQRALAVAEAAARSGLVAPPGWRIVSLSGGASALGFLAVGGQPAWLDLVVALLAEQLYRAELVRARVAGLVRRLVGEPEAGLPAARREAAELGLQLADAYWAAVMIVAPHGAPAGCPGGDRARVGAGRGVRRAAGTRHGAPVSGDRRVGVVRAGCGMRPAARAGGRRTGDRGRRPRRACPRSGPGWPNWRRSPGWGRAPRTNRC